jgi:polyferredoxin
MGKLKSRYLRFGMLAIVLGCVIYLALGYGGRSFEAYCPFGGVESLWGLFTTGEFSCALGPLNLSFLLALLVLVLLCKKAFCSWACPIGFISELSIRASGRIWNKRLSIPVRVDQHLKSLRYVVLAVALFFTYRTEELVLRGYDPFYLIFSGFGHGSAGLVSVFVLAGILIGMWIVPMFFCRYLCPLGAVFDPFSRVAVLRVTRDASKCTGCGKCGRACLHSIPVQSLPTVRKRDCTNCLECLDACPEKDALQLRAEL